MNPKFKYLFKNTGILAISNFSSKILVFFMVPLYTSVLSTKEYGVIDLIITTIGFILPILTLNIKSSVMVFTMDKTQSKQEVASVGLAIELTGCIIFSFIVSLNKLFHWIEFAENLKLVVILYLFSQAFLQYMSNLARGLEKVADLGISGIIGTLTSIAFNIYFLLYLKLGLTGFFYANILSSVIQLLFYFIRLKIWNLILFNSFNKHLVLQMVAYSLPHIATVIGWQINNTLDKYIVSYFCGITSNGILAVSYKIPSIINVVQNIFLDAWLISAIKEYKNGDDFYKKMFEYYNLLMCVCCSILILFTRPLASFLYAKDFYKAWEYVPLLLVCAVITGASGFIGPILAATKDSKTMAKSTIYGSVVNIVLNVILVYLMGIQGAVIATVISSYVIYAYRKSVIGNKIESNLYSSIMLVWILLIIQSFIEIYLQNYILELIVLSVILILLREPIKACIRKVKYVKNKK